MIKSILIDATHYKAESPTGVEVYTTRLLPLLSKELQEKGVQVNWVGHEPQLVGESLPGVSWIMSPHKRFWGQRALPALLKAQKPDLFFTPSGLLPIRYKGKMAMTVHDLAAYIVPESFTPTQLVRLRGLSRLSAKKAAVIITPSHFTRLTMEKVWKVASHKIVVVPHGYAKTPVSAEAVQGVTVDPLFLYVGRIEWKKNLWPIIDAFKKIAPTQPCQLVLAGSDGFRSKEIKNQIKKLPPNIASRVILPGYISEAQKEWLLQRATACLVPGMAEGFGLPVLEGFAHKVPVICAQAGSLPEVGKDAVLYAQGDIPTDWAIQMEKILSDYHVRKVCAERGEMELAHYSWNEAARLTAEALVAVD